MFVGSLKLDIYGNDLAVGKLFIIRRSAGETTYVLLLSTQKSNSPLAKKWRYETNSRRKIQKGEQVVLLNRVLVIGAL